MGGEEGGVAGAAPLYIRHHICFIWGVVTVGLNELGCGVYIRQ